MLGAEYRNGKKHGKGKLTFYASGDVYEGGWVDDKRSGQGKYSYTSGACYEGEYKAGLCHGRGKFTYLNKDVFEGEWKDDKRNGPGVYIYTSIGDKFQGASYSIPLCLEIAAH